MKNILVSVESNASKDDLAKFLVRLAFNITITARATYGTEVDAVDRPSALKGLNEVSHRVVARAMHVMNDSCGQPAEAFADVISEIAKHYGCVPELENAVAFASET